MATEKQIIALEKWLQVNIEDMDFDTCSDYLDMLHNASDEYNADKNKKGIVKQTKEAILDELRKAGKITRPEGEQKITPKETEDKVIPGSLPFANRELLNPFELANAEVVKMGAVFRSCVIEGEKIVSDMDLLSNAGVTPGSQAGLVQKISTTLFIEAMKRGLLR